MVSTGENNQLNFNRVKPQWPLPPGVESRTVPDAEEIGWVCEEHPDLPRDHAPVAGRGYPVASRLSSDGVGEAETDLISSSPSRLRASVQARVLSTQSHWSPDARAELSSSTFWPSASAS